MLSVLLSDFDENSRLATKSELQESNLVSSIEDCGTLHECRSLAMQHNPNIIIIDISQETETALRVVEYLNKKLRNSLIFVTSDNMDMNLALAAMRVGAREFLARPLNSDDLMKALHKAKEALTNSDDPDGGQIITIFSNKGGIGKSTVATNLSLSIANQTRKRVALIDLNLQLGDVTTFLDMTPSYDIAYLINNMDRVDEEFLLSSLDRFGETSLYVLADPPYAEQAEDISSERINTLLTTLKETFNYVIIDTTSAFDAKTLVALDLADHIFLISMINLPCIRNTQRCLDLFTRLNYPQDKIKLIMNRYLPDEEITTDDVEDTLSHKIYWKIPNNYFTVMTAINRGIPIFDLESGNNICKNFNELARKITKLDQQFVQEEVKEISKSPIQSIVAKVLKK